MRTMLTIANNVKIIISDIGHNVYEIYSVFRPFDIAGFFYTFWLFRNFYSGDAHHANYVKQNLHQDFQHSVNCVYQIYSVLKLFEIAICFAHFGFDEISTPVMRTMLTMVNVVQIIISDIAHNVYEICSVVKAFEIAGCFAHFAFDELSTQVMRTLLTMPNKIYINISKTP